MTLGKGQYKVKVKIEGEKPIYIIPAKHFYPMSKFSCNGSKRYAEYEVVPVNGILLSFVILAKGQFKIKVKTENEKHIYIIPAKYSCQYLSSIVVTVVL